VTPAGEKHRCLPKKAWIDAVPFHFLNQFPSFDQPLLLVLLGVSLPETLSDEAFEPSHAYVALLFVELSSLSGWLFGVALLGGILLGLPVRRKFLKRSELSL
jgi:hypothetical protein